MCEFFGIISVGQGLTKMTLAQDIVSLMTEKNERHNIRIIRQLFLDKIRCTRFLSDYLNLCNYNLLVVQYF